MSLPDIELTLLSNETATRSGWEVLRRGGLFCFAVTCAGWNGATAKLQMLGPDGTTALDVGADATLTANGSCLAELPAGSYRVAISTAVPSSGVYSTLKEVRRFSH